MTAINLCFRGSQIFIACDTAVSTPGLGIVGHKSKCFTIPHARAAIACSGPVTVSALWVFEALSAIDVIDVTDLVRRAPTLLREGWNHSQKDAHHTVFLAGITRDDAAKAFMMSSLDDFAVIDLAPGIYTLPLLRGIREEVIAEREHTSSVPTENPVKVKDAPWHKMVQSCVAFLDEQAAEHPGAVGGFVECTLIQAESIHQHRLRPIRPTPLAAVAPCLNQRVA